MSEYIIGQIIPYRQKMTSKIGIDISIYKFLEVLVESNAWGNEEEFQNNIVNSFTIISKSFTKYTNLIDLIFDVIHLIVLDNKESKKNALANVMILQNFIFISKLPAIFGVLFGYSTNSAHNHQNKKRLYNRIYKFNKIKPILDQYIQSMKTTNNKKYIVILRKLWVIAEDPLPLVQDYVFDQIYDKDDHDLVYKVRYWEDSAGIKVSFV